MSTRFEQTIATLKQRPKRWLITGAAGFIGSHLLEFLLANDQFVTGLDNFSTGNEANLDEVKARVGAKKWAHLFFVRGDIRSLDTCRTACEGVDYVLHQAALGSVLRSIQDPISTNEVNISGFLTMLVAARDAQVKSFTYASSSSIYGDEPALPKIEERIGKPLSPYALTKCANESYAAVFADTYEFKTIGLRYFNVFGPRQNKQGAYAAVIPKWIASMLNDEVVYINGDGETSRDFCFIDNVIQANVLAAIATETAKNQVYNIALNDRTSLNQLFFYLKHVLASHGINYAQSPVYRDFCQGDMKHSQAQISKAEQFLGYQPLFKVHMGIEKTISWFIEHA